MFCWETVCWRLCGCYFETHTHPNTAADGASWQGHSLRAAASSSRAKCTTTQMSRGTGQRASGVDLSSKFPRFQSERASGGRARTSLIDVGLAVDRSIDRKKRVTFLFQVRRNRNVCPYQCLYKICVTPPCHRM